MKYAILTMVLLLLVAACTQQPKQQTQPAAAQSGLEFSGHNNPQQGCYLVKHVRADVYNCFGCSPNGVCTRPDPKNWQQTDQRVPYARGYRCFAAPHGCVVA